MDQDLKDQALRLHQKAVLEGERVTPRWLAQQIETLGIKVPPTEIQPFVAAAGFGEYRGFEHYIPLSVLGTIKALLAKRSVETACDPVAGFGTLAAFVHETTGAKTTTAIEWNADELALGRALAPYLDWKESNLRLTQPENLGLFDVVVCVPPFGMRIPQHVDVGPTIPPNIRDYDSYVVARSAERLSTDGLGIYVVAANFFTRANSIVTRLQELGVYIESALEIPRGSFAPYTRISTYLITVSRRASPQMFVGQLGQDPAVNELVVKSLGARSTSGTPEFGRLVNPDRFRGFEYLSLQERIAEADRLQPGSSTILGDISTDIRLGKPHADFNFTEKDNVIYVPLIGITDVVESAASLVLKPQNYAQVTIDPDRSDSRFVARFLNSTLGRSVREASKSGVIAKLNSKSLRSLLIRIPPLADQRAVVQVATSLEAERNTILGLQNDLASMQDRLWSDPNRIEEISAEVAVLSQRLAGGATLQASESLDKWFETLPFPLASILRAWQATPGNDFKSKYEHLLHFFEASAEFFSVILLSAFASRPEFFEPHREKLIATWQKQNLSLERATFGTWKVAVEYLSKRTRELLSGDSDARALCSEIFEDPSLSLPTMLSSAEISSILSTTNKLRNDWSGHGGVVGQDEAKSRNDRLVAQVHRLREIMGDGWQHVQLIHGLGSQHRRGIFENEVAVLMGSNSEFLKVAIPMSTWLDVERLYLASKDSSKALLLLPLIRVGPSPASAKNACYFFSRMDRDGARLISYHFSDQPEIREDTGEIRSAITTLLRQQRLGG